jgi:hypothetical protein
MRAIASRTLASVLAALLAVSCRTVREPRQPNIKERVFLSRTPRAVASPVVEELELRRAFETLLQEVGVEEARAELRRMVVDPRFHDRRPEELRVVLASWGSGPMALDEIARGYRALCAATHRSNCLEGPLTNSSVYEIAFDFAMGSQWDGFVGELKSTVDPSTIQIVLLTGLVIFMATIAIPELTSKIPAAIATAVLTAYLGAQAVCDLIFGWIKMVGELDAATTFDEIRAAGQRYGRLMGAQTARILILLATAAIAQGGLIARLMKLPRATQASAALAAETGGVGLEAVSAIKEVRALQGGVAIIVEGASRGAVGVTMAVHGEGPRANPASSTSAEKTTPTKWGNPKSTPVYGHTFLEHGSKLTREQLVDRARNLGHQIGQWIDDDAAARFIAEVARRGPGIHDAPLPGGLGRTFLANGTELATDMARVVVKPNGTVRTAFPFSSAHPR